MAWSWSHSPEAYQYAESKLRKLSQKKIKEIWAEWKAYKIEQAEDTEADLEDLSEWQEEYAKAYKEAGKIVKQLGKDVLADDIWQWASDYATCTNGGWEAYMCPYRCGCHNVPFSSRKEQ